MLDATIGPEFGFHYTNAGTPATIAGTSVTPGASNAEGSWTQIASSANITSTVHSVLLTISGGATSGAQKNHLLDIGIDPAGGTSYTAIVSNIICGGSAPYDIANRLFGGRPFLFPIYIPAGSSVAVRIQGNNATAGTVSVAAEFFGLPQRPELARAGQYSETIGTITGSAGVSFTPGNSSAEGSWTSLGTTTKELWWWQLCMQINDTITQTSSYMCDLAYGDVTNKVTIIENARGFTATGEENQSVLQTNCYKRVPGGSELFVRGTVSVAGADTGFNAVAVGIGG